MTQEEAVRVIDRLVADLARATGQSDRVVRLGYGLAPADQEDHPRPVRRVA